MSPVKTLFDQAQLAEAAYAVFIDNMGNLISDGSLVQAALKDEGMSATQAADFVTHWRVIDQYATGSQSEDPF